MVDLKGRPLLDMPALRFRGSHAVLAEPVVFETPITGAACSIKNVRLDAGGLLTLSVGYVWDFASGPAVDTPDMVYGSIAHDALYDLMNAGVLASKHRKAADKFFVELLRQAGCPWYRRAWVYAAVRWGYPAWRLIAGPGNKQRDG
jgi:hypothetical protein